MLDWNVATKQEKREALHQWFKDNGLPYSTFYDRCARFDEVNRWATGDDLIEACRRINEGVVRNSEQHFQLIYGEAEGSKRYEACRRAMNKAIDNRYPVGRIITVDRSHWDVPCEASQLAFMALQKRFPNLVFATTVGELCIKDNDATYYYDAAVMSRKVIIEFQETDANADPEIYGAGDTPEGARMEARDIWARDLNKAKIAESFGFKVFHLWQRDYEDDPESAIRILATQIIESYNNEEE